TLKKYNLEYIPEAHNYLKYKGFIIDYTGAGFSPGKYEVDLLAEKEIRPEQITDFKVAYQKEFLSSWLLEQKHIGYSLEEIWTIREQCIRDLFT
ncbi:MAG: hypothetical protein JNL60_17745, partial [Bacteroidia bacterium]|nr:hypothetical protein [Bacteroidia bacterium]